MYLFTVIFLAAFDFKNIIEIIEKSTSVKYLLCCEQKASGINDFNSMTAYWLSDRQHMNG